MFPIVLHIFNKVSQTRKYYRYNDSWKTRKEIERCILHLFLWPKKIKTGIYTLVFILLKGLFCRLFISQIMENRKITIEWFCKFG